jgi:anti-sigma factor RsiW
MKNCERIESQLIAYMDGRASVRERRGVDQHLAECADCRARVEGFRGLWKVLEESPAVEPSAWFDARLRQRIAAEPPPALWARLAAWVPQPRLALATLALIAVGCWAALTPRPNLPAPVAMNEQEEFRMIKNMQVLENYEMLKDLDALSELQGN